MKYYMTRKYMFYEKKMIKENIGKNKRKFVER